MPPQCRDPCGRRRDRRSLRGRSSAKALAQQGLQLLAVEIAETETFEGASLIHEILAADRRADRQKSFRQRRYNPGQLSNRNQKRQAKVQILPHVAMLCEHNPLAPVTGFSETIVRAVSIHPLLALGCVMMRQRKVWTGMAKAFAYRDAFGIKRVRDLADQSMRAFL